jgi:alcohol dehydrogenase
MSPFDITPLGRLIFGAGTLAQLGEVASALGRRALLISDPGLNSTAHPDRAKALLHAAGLSVSVFNGVKENPTDAVVQLGVQAAAEHQADLLVALGGGSAMDCTKGINFLFTNGGRIADYRGHDKATKPMLPSIGIPTTTGTGSEAQSYALITDASTHMKMACGDKKVAFRVAILDPELTITQPAFVSAVTGIDAISHAVESFVSRKANPYSRMCALQAWNLLSRNFEKTLRSPKDIEARANMQLGAYFAGMSIEASMLGVCHSCANPLTAHYSITHGVAIGLMLPHVVRFNAETVANDYQTLTGSVDQLVQACKHFVQFANLPTRLRDVGVHEGILPLLAHEANEQWTARFNPREVTESDILALYQAAW